MATASSSHHQTEKHHSPPNKELSHLQNKILKSIIRPSMRKHRADSGSSILSIIYPVKPSIYSPITSEPFRDCQSPSEVIRTMEDQSTKTGSFTHLNSSPFLVRRSDPYYLATMIRQASTDISTASVAKKIDTKVKKQSRSSQRRFKEGKILDNREDEKPNSPSFSPRTMGNHYNYNSQHLMFIPEKLDSSIMNKTSFMGFNDLARKMNSTHQSILGGIVMEDVSMRSQDRKKSGGQGISEKKFETLRKTLEFNKLQKDTYEHEIERQKKEKVLPLLKNEHEKYYREQQMRCLKVMPSQSFCQQPNAWDSILLPNSPVIEMRNKPVNGPRSSKERKLKTEVDLPETSAIKATYKYKYFWYFADEKTQHWIPNAREGHTLTTVGKQIILYGGFGNDTKGDITIYYPMRNVWKQPTVKGDLPLHGRQGHSACEYMDSMIIFGGEDILEIEPQYREYLYDTRAFYPDKGEWKYISCTGTSGMIGPRRNHAAVIHDKYMYVYGGVTSQGTHLNELWVLDLKTCVWAQLKVGGGRQDNVAYHSMCACYVEKNYFNTGKNKNATRAFEEGLYVFGGKDGEGNILDILRYLDISVRPLQWKYPVTKGNPPSERFNHTMLFYQPLSLLLIYGGKNKHFYDPSRFKELNDIRILSLETMSWNPTTAYGDIPRIPRYNHAATLFGSTMIVFGGLSIGEYVAAETKIVEFNQGAIQKLVDEHEQNKISQLVKIPTQIFSPEPSPTRKAKKQGVVSFLPMPTESSGERSPGGNSKLSFKKDSLQHWRTVNEAPFH